MKDVSNAMRAQILTAAVPYIKQYTDQYVVVKYGGNAMIDEELKKICYEGFGYYFQISRRKGCSRYMVVVQLLIAP